MRFDFNFKRLLQGILLLVLAMATSSCDKFLRSQKEEKNILEFNVTALSCVKTLPEKLQRILDSETTLEEVSSFTTCVADTIENFKTRVRGVQSQMYSYSELSLFFNHYYFPDNPIPDSFALSLMQLKQALFGGDDKNVTFQELDLIAAWIKKMNEPIMKMSPSLHLVLMRNKVGTAFSVDKVKQALQTVEDELIGLIKSTQLAQSQYKFEQSMELLKNGSQFANKYFSSGRQELIEKSLPLLPLLKNVLIKRGRYLTLAEFEESLRCFFKVYGIFVLHKNLHTSESYINTLDDLNHSGVLVLEFLKFLEKTPAMISENEIDLNEVKKFIAKAVDIKDGVFPGAVNADIAFSTLKIALAKMFDDQNVVPLEKLHGITVKHLKEMEREIFQLQTLSEVSQKIMQASSPKYVVDAPEMLQRLKAVLEIKSRAEQLKEYGLENETAWIHKGLAQFPEFFQKKYMIQYNSGKNILIAGNHVPARYTDSALARVILMNALSRVLILGYSADNSLPVKERILTVENMGQWYTDFSPIGVNLKAFDPRSDNSGIRGFYEANFFTFSGNGDSKMDFDETYELVSFMFSVGLGGATKLRQDLHETRCDTGDRDVFGERKILRTCFMQVWRTKMPLVFANLPGLGQYVKSLDDEQYREYFLTLEKGALGTSPQFYDTNDIRTLVTVTHYIESIYTVFDLNHDDVLQYNEVQQASGRFLELLLEQVKKDAPSWLAGPKLAQTTFEYMVFYGEKPGLAGLSSFWFEGKSEKTANRMNVLKVFDVIRAALEN